jgi:uncharacterized protein
VEVDVHRKLGSLVQRSRAVVLVVVGALSLSLVAAGPPSDHPGKGQGHGPGGNGKGPWSQQPDDPEESAELEPADYIALADTLSQPDYEETVKETYGIPTHDGEELYVELTRPDPEVHGDGPWPVIMEASPYHGTLADREGIRIFPDPEDEDGDKIGMTGYFAPRGYAVAMVGLRGTGRSSGCLDHLGQDDAQDLKDAVEWAAAQGWSTGDVGLTGHSYVGSTPSVAAAMEPEGLVTIAPSAGLASMYDHQFHQGVPWFLQWAGPHYAYPLLSTNRDLPPGINTPFGPTGDDFGNNPQDTGCGWQNSALLAGHGQVTGQYQDWHEQRDWREGAAAADIPIFMIHGVNDNAARIPAAEWFFADREPRGDDKVWVGQWDHGSAGATTCTDADSVGHVNCRFDQWKYALHAWFDKHLKGSDVDTGPTVEAFLNGDNVSVDRVWDAQPGELALYLDAADGSLSTERPEEEGSVSFSALAGDGGVEFASAPFEEETVLRGMPELDLRASVVGQVVHLVTTLWVEDEQGERRAANFCATNTHLRNDVRTPEPVAPGEPMDLAMQCFTQTHRIAEGESLVLEVATTSAHHVPTFAHDADITVHTGPEAGGYTLPRVPDAVVHDDVPLREGEDGDDAEPHPSGPAQAPVEETVTVVAPSAGLFGADGVTDAYVEFEVEEAFDNARLDAVAEVAGPPADIDLHLQRREGDGWETVASGETFDLARETLSLDRPPPGEYRLRVQNWAGGPNQVDVLVRFVNSEGEIGG